MDVSPTDVVIGYIICATDAALNSCKSMDCFTAVGNAAMVEGVVDSTKVGA